MSPTRTFRGNSVILSDTVVGFVLAASGIATPVLNPLRRRVAYDLRVAAAEAGGWHLIFIDRFEQNALEPLDSAAVWYGHFDGARWRDLTPIAVIHDGRLDHDLSPDIGVDGDRLRFAFAFQKSFAYGETPRGKQGMIMLRRDGGRWSADTLDMPGGGPLYVRLVRGAAAGTWHVGLVQPYYEGGRYRDPSLFVAEYDSTWHAPELVAGDSVAIQRPSLTRLRDGVVASWLRAGGGVGWTRLPTTGPSGTPPRPTAMFDGSEEYGAVALDPTTVLWYARAGLERSALGSGSSDTVRAMLYRRGQTVDLGAVAVPNDAFIGHAVAASPTEIVMFTTKAPQPRHPIIQTVVSRLRVRCLS